jgi:uncharacterized protein (TIGR00297 family)
MTHAQTLTLGLVLACAIAFVAWRAQALSASGGVAAATVGTLAMAAGWSWGVILVAYFVSASLLSRYRAAEKETRTSGRVDKSGARDAAQVLANGGVFAVAALGHSQSPDPLWQSLAAGALAASAADTWATEIGTLARSTPRSILDWQPVAVGTSGGVTTPGLFAGLCGALIIAVLAVAVRWPTQAALAALVGGVIGCLLDSAAGAALQARRWCANCDAATEQRTHRCGSPTKRVGGIAWLDNDGVNALSTIGGALFGATAARYF